MTIIGENIKKLRERAGMTAKELSEKSGVGQSTISEIEVGKIKNPRTETLMNISKALNISMDDLSVMELEYEYLITDVEEAMAVILNQENLMLDGELLTDESRLQLANSIKMALEFTRQMQSKTKKL